MSKMRASQATGHPCSKDEEVKRRIAERAYYIAENRQFEPGHELDDWIEAEACETLDPSIGYPVTGFQS